MTQIVCETTKNVNGPSQSDVDARARLSTRYVRPKQKNTCAWVNNPTQQRKEQTMEALREEKWLRFCPWIHTQQEGREFAVRGCLTTRGGEEENLHETQKCPELVREEPTDKFVGRGEQAVERMHDGHNEQAREENRTGRASMESWVECGCGQRTDSPATPLPKVITAHPPTAIAAQLPNRTLKRLKEVG